MFAHSLNIDRNKLRLVTKILYRRNQVLIRPVPTHHFSKLPPPIQRPIRSRVELEQVIEELDHLVDKNPKTGTPEHDRMELLALLIGAYEAEQVVPPAPVTPQQIVKFMAEQKNAS